MLILAAAARERVIKVLFVALAAAGLGACAERAPEPPGLVVFIVADQMGDDLLDLHGAHLTGGFRRLLDEGRRYTNAVVDHAPTNSMPGHFSAASGAYPSRHGVIDNSYAERTGDGWRAVAGFADPACPLVPGEDARPAEGGVGPARFGSATIVEWVLAADPGARFASLGVGGGVSALHAGAAKGPVLWYMPDKGVFGSSACYLERLPAWAEAFNASLGARFMNADWTLNAPPAMRAALGPDAAPYENGGTDTEFPHRRPPSEAALRQWFNFTPFADIAMLDLAKAALEAEALGEDETTDILTIGLSMLDHVGHRFGPFSVEQADTLYRLDAALGDFFDHLDSEVGEGRWIAALTADHGAPPAPEDAGRWGVSGARRISEAEALAAIETIAAAAAAEPDPLQKNGAAVAAARGLDLAARVITEEEIAAGAGSGDPLLELYARSYWPGRISLHPLYQTAEGRSAAAYGMIVIPAPYAVIDWAASIHGSPYAYDREVELIVMGGGVSPGVSAAPARTIDVAPTLAHLAGIAPTGEIDGRVLDLR